MGPAQTGDGGGRRHWPQLDGVRAVAVTVVVAFHLGHLPGGWVGVDVFFVLSGYLITWILLSEGDRVGRLRWFWGRRVRRLLPAVLALILVLALYSWAGGPGLVPAQVRAPALATLFYTANWQQIIAGHSYFAQFAAPNPFEHAWSLAIEEQYYLLWPLLLGGVLTVSRWSKDGRPRRAVVTSTLALAAVSAVWMGVAANSLGVNRAYLGTDTRAWELLIGGAAAMIWPPGRRLTGTRIPAAAAVLGAAGLVAGVALAGGPPTWIWNGGLVAVAVGAAALIVGTVHAPDGFVSRLLSLRPLCWLGLISYSLYLWHWPVIVLVRPDTTGLSGAGLLGARVGAMLIAACGSYYLVERPMRSLDWRALGGRVHLPEVTFAGVAVVIVAALIAAGTVGPPPAPSATVAGDHFAGPTQQEKRGHLDLPPATASHPYRLWILGDSVMFDASLGVETALQATGAVSVVANTAFPGWSPARDRGWPADAMRTVAAYHPQIVIGTWSWDDPQAAADPVGYQKFLENSIRTLLTPGDGVRAVILLEFPQTGPSMTFSARPSSDSGWRRRTLIQKAWDATANRAAAAFPGRAMYLTTDRGFAPGGRFYTWLRPSGGGWVRARKVDNAHMCPYGAAVFGALVTDDLSYFLKLPPMRPGWERGPWTRDHRYNDPAGACPADQPPPGYTGIPVPA